MPLHTLLIACRAFILLRSRFAHGTDYKSHMCDMAMDVCMAFVVRCAMGIKTSAMHDYPSCCSIRTGP